MLDDHLWSYIFAYECYGGTDCHDLFHMYVYCIQTLLEHPDCIVRYRLNYYCKAKWKYKGEPVTMWEQDGGG